MQVLLYYNSIMMNYCVLENKMIDYFCWFISLYKNYGYSKRKRTIIIPSW